MIAVTVLVACVPGLLTPDEAEQVAGLTFDPTALPEGSSEVVNDERAVALGRRLYADASLSVEGTSVSCETCHDLCIDDEECTSLLDGEASGADPRTGAVSEGAGGPMPRNTPTILETAYRDRWGWVGRYCHLDDMSALPLTLTSAYGHPEDTAVTEIAAKIRASYGDDWTAVFDVGTDDQVLDQAGLVLEAFLRTLPATVTALDRLLDGHEEALDATEIRGLKLFVGKAHCIDCHSGSLLSDGELHVTGVAGNDLGRAALTDEELCFLDGESGRPPGSFVTPPLRNVALTPPYMHDGSLATLEDVVWHYDQGGAPDGEVVGHPDPKLSPLFLDPGERSDLVAFLATLGAVVIAGVLAVCARAAPLEVLEGVELELHGFVDVGWFDVGGNGASYRFDHTDPDGTWVYTGDPWAAAINAQGDPADLGNAFDNLQRDDPIASGGRPTFLVNTVELATTLRGPHVDAEAGVWLEPRSGQLGTLGDRVSLDRAVVIWHPLVDRTFEMRFGKLESVFGIEWYQRRAPDRPGVTPSLIARYTTGTPVGVGVRAGVGEHLDVDGQIANGGTTTERFGHFVNELDTNGVPTGTVRVEVTPLKQPVLRVGLSGQAGAQDGIVEVVPMWQVGADLALDLNRFNLRAEILRSDQDQGDAGVVDRLRAVGWMVQVWVHARRPWLVPVLRVDRREAELEVASVGNRYESDVLRLSAAVRIDATFNLSVRAEASHLWELEGEPIADDVITTSVLYRW